MTEQELIDVLCQAAGYAKLVCGVGNNAAHMAMLDGYDHARRCKAYRHEIKRAFKMAIDEWHTYEKHLLHEQQFRMFHVADMPEEVRRKYGDITDREYYDYWSATGCTAYEKTRPLLTSLQNKYRKSLVRHGYDVVSRDLVDRGYGEVKDFLFMNNEQWDGDIITNPPYAFAQEFVEQALKMIQPGRKVAMFLKLTFLEGKKRAELFKSTPPIRVWVSSSRLKCAMNGDFDSFSSSAAAYGWFIWEKGFKGHPEIRWFN